VARDHCVTILGINHMCIFVFISGRRSSENLWASRTDGEVYISAMAAVVTLVRATLCSGQEIANPVATVLSPTDDSD
jgi:hypothetical protein